MKIKIKRFFLRKKIKLLKLYYKYVYGFKVFGFDATMMPQTGKGDFVSVYSKGKIIQIINEKGNENLGNYFNEIRIIPCQPNHGIMVEHIVNGKIHSRKLLDIKQLNKNVIYASNVEQLANKNK